MRLSAARLALPYDENLPPESAKSATDPRISDLVRRLLSGPKLRVRLRSPRSAIASGVPVPEASVYEDRNPAAIDDDIRSARKGAVVPTADDPERRQGFKYGTLGRGVFFANAPHERATRTRRIARNRRLNVRLHHRAVFYHDVLG